MTNESTQTSAHANDSNRTILSAHNNWNFNWEDASQVMIGAFTLGVPISFSEEAWRMGETLAAANLLMLSIMSLVFLSLYTHQVVFQGNVRRRIAAYLLRILLAYGLTLLVVGLILIALNKFPIGDEPIVALKRLLIIAMPASMGAIIVDSFDKE
jgi:uncharacterized membrane protein